MSKIAFIDRDGCLVEEPEDEQVDRLGKIKLLPGVIPALRRIQQAGYEMIMVTNQDGLGTPRFPKEDFDRCHSFILDIFASQGIQFSKVFICPHYLEDNCSCRKPKVGLLEEILRRDDWSRQESFVAGDRDTDMELARNLGVKGFQVSPTYSWEQIARDLLDKPRRARTERNTKETQIAVDCCIDGRGDIKVETGIGFLDHMIEAMAKHAGFDLYLNCTGDLWVDDHHTTEDIAIALGQTIKSCLQDKRGIERFAFTVPMDESLAEVALDLSGRAYLSFDATFNSEKIGELSTDMVKHFCRSFAESLGANIHIKVTGENDHHKAEAIFKALAKTLGQACSRTQNRGSDIPSTKGQL